MHLTTTTSTEKPHEYWCGHCGAREGPFLTPDKAQDAANDHGRAHIDANPKTNFRMLVLEEGTFLRYRIACKATNHTGPWHNDEIHARAELDTYRQAAPEQALAYLDAEEWPTSPEQLYSSCDGCGKPTVLLDLCDATVADMTGSFCRECALEDPLLPDEVRADFKKTLTHMRARRVRLGGAQATLPIEDAAEKKE